MGICAAHSSTDGYGFHFSQCNTKGHLNKASVSLQPASVFPAGKSQPWATVTRISVKPALTDWSPLGNRWTIFASKWPQNLIRPTDCLLMLGQILLETKDSGEDLGRGDRVAGCRHVLELGACSEKAACIHDMCCQMGGLYSGCFPLEGFLDNFIKYFWTLLHSELSFWPSQTLLPNVKPTA